MIVLNWESIQEKIRRAPKKNSRNSKNVDTSNDDSSDQEIANLYLVSKEEEVNEVHDESNSIDELQNVYKELYEESLKMENKNCILRKQVVSFISEINYLKKHVDKLKIKNDKLNAKILDLTTCLKKSLKVKRV